MMGVGETRAPLLAPLLALLTDFGLADGYVGVMKAVILGIAPGLPLVDLTHEVAPQDVEGGAWVIGASWRSLPMGSVLLGVVDPGVGSARRAVALEVEGRYVVGPDNGLFTPLISPQPTAAPAPDLADRAKQTGRSTLRAVALDNPRYHLPHASATFHGRDIFAPCAAHLAMGTPLASLGSPLAPDTLVRLPIPLYPQWEDDALVGRVAHVDHYGNLITNISGARATQAFGAPGVWLRVVGAEVHARAGHFAAGPAGAPFFLRDSSGALAIAVRDGSAAALLGAGRGDAVHVFGLPEQGHL